MKIDTNRYYFVPYPLDWRIARVMVDTKVRVKPDTEDEAVIKTHKGSRKKWPQLDKYESYNRKQALRKIREEWKTKDKGNY